MKTTYKKNISFKIPYPTDKTAKSAFNRRFGFNAYYSGKHWQVRKRDADYWHAITQEAIKHDILHPEIFDKPVEIKFWFNDNLDCSNHAAEVKMIEDGCKGILLKDDNRKYVKGISMYFHNEDFILVKISEV